LLASAACSSDSNDDDDGTDTDTTEPTATAYALPTEDAGDNDGGEAQPTTVISDTDTDDPVDSDGGSSGADALLSSINPLQLLSAASSGAPSIAPADPSLEAALLTAGDLPAGFTPFGTFSFNVPSEYGELQMAASMFMSGDILAQELNAMVMSAAVAIPADQLDELGDPGDWADASEDDLGQLRDIMEETGVGLSELDLLDASDLGDGGLGMHMTMDFGGLFGALGAPDDANPFAEGISMDMYMFIDGDKMLMTVVMWPAGGPSGVDGRALAEVMDGRVS
jgi:hypothetical protein